MRSLSGLQDYALIVITMLPFAFGVLAYHQLGDYETVITLHILSGEALLVTAPFTKLGHMVLFFFARFKIQSEYSMGTGDRTW